MEHALAAAPRLQIDAKRIAATSGAIAVHVAILMMLMMPAQVSTPETREEVTVPNWEVPRIPPPPPPPPPVERTRPQTTVTPPPQVMPVVEPPVVNVDQAPSVVDYVAPVVPDVAPDTFDTDPVASVFQQLATRVAPPPPYPAMAVRRGIEGTVMLRIHVDANGSPIEVSIERSSGSALLDEAALKVVKTRWRFVPAQSGGQATAAWALVPVEFVLD